MSTFFELHIMGGWLFMSVLFIILVSIIVVTALAVIQAYFKTSSNLILLKNFIETIKFLGGIAAIWGILGQGIGIYQACVAIQEMQDVSPALLAGGFQVSMITALYGIIIFLLSLIIRVILKTKYNKLSMK